MPTFAQSSCLSALCSAPSKAEAGAALKDVCQELNEQGVAPGNITHKTAADVEQYLDETMGESLLMATDNIETVRWLLAGGQRPDEWREAVRSFERGLKCGAVWESACVAYRCRTCGLNPCMSLCVACFKAADHSTHDFNRFWSQAGGACDCGDVQVMRDIGFCPKHSAVSVDDAPLPPPSMSAVALFVIPKVMVRLFIWYREQYRIRLSGSVLMHQFTQHPSTLTAADSEAVEDIVSKASETVAFLQQLADIGGPMRTVLARTLTDSELYGRFVSETPNASPSNVDWVRLSLDWRSSAAFRQCVNSLQPICTTSSAVDELDKESVVCGELAMPNMLSELLFWVVRLNYPQKLVTFVLSLLPDEDYKTELTHRFFALYSRTSELLRQSGASAETLANRMIHISVQILSSEETCTALIGRMNLLRLLMVCVDRFVAATTIDCQLNARVSAAAQTRHLVIDCSSSVQEHHAYWSIVSDLHNVLSHRSVAIAFLSDRQLLVRWADFLAKLQGMNVNMRKAKGDHVQFESRSYYAAFTVELESSAVTLWNLLIACVHSQAPNAVLIPSVLEVVSLRIQEWFGDISFLPPSCWKSTRSELCFHLPLHRTLAAFLHVAQRLHLPLDQLITARSLSFFGQLFCHPLQIQVGRSEINCKMWIRNGHSMIYQSCLYAQSHFHSAFIDLDYYLMQVCATVVNADWLVLMVFDRFHLTNWLSMCDGADANFWSIEPYLRPEWSQSMLEAALRLIVGLTSLPLNAGLNDEDALRLEIATLLCMEDRTYSQLKENMPDKSLSSIGFATSAQYDSTFESILKEMAIYKEPTMDSAGKMSQGTYAPKDEVWSKYFDPLFIALRSMQPKDFTSTLERYNQFLTAGSKASSGISTSKDRSSEGEVTWLPYRWENVKRFDSTYFAALRRLFSSRSLHAVLYVIFYQAYKDSTVVSEWALQLAVYMLELCLLYSPRPTSNDEVNPTAERQRLEGLEFEEPSEADGASSTWTSLGECTNLHHLYRVYDSSSIFHNLRRPMGSFTVVGTLPKFRSDDAGSSADDLSMFEILLRLHRKLGAWWHPACGDAAAPESDVRSGDSKAAALARVLQRACNADVGCQRYYDQLRVKLDIDDQPMTSTVDGSSADDRQTSDREQRRKLMQERQKKVMQQFASQQKRVMDKLIVDHGELAFAADDDSAARSRDVSMSDGQSVDAEPEAPVVEYHCVICNTATPTNFENVVALVIHCSPTNVLGKMRPMGERPLELMRTKEDTPMTRFGHYVQQYRTLDRHFNTTSCVLSGCASWVNALRVKTCGHFVHVACHLSYMDTLVREEALNMPLLRIGDGEFMCPMCRQLANAVMPVLPTTTTTDASATSMTLSPQLSYTELLNELTSLVRRSPEKKLPFPVAKLLDDFVKSIREWGRPKYTARYWPIEENGYYFISILRTNIEWKLYVKQLKAEFNERQNSALDHLMDFVVDRFGWTADQNASRIIITQLGDVRLTSVTAFAEQMEGARKKLGLSAVDNESEGPVPLLLQDCTSHFYRLGLIALSGRANNKKLQKSLLSATCGTLLAVSLCQSAFNMFFSYDAAVCSRLLQLMTDGQNLCPIGGIAAKVLDACLQRIPDQSRSVATRDRSADEMETSEGGDEVMPAHFIAAMKRNSTGFLANALLFAQHARLLDETTAVIEDDALTDYDRLLSAFFAGQDAYRLAVDGCPLEAWIGTALDALQTSPALGQGVFGVEECWDSGGLVALPREYDVLFERFYKAECPSCRQVPTETLVCLVCGDVLCLRGKCCSGDAAGKEAQRHVDQCGAGTGLLMSVQSSMVYALRGGRVAVWGSLYLDVHGEEDRNLKRGKPLYLSTERHGTLECQWRKQRINTTRTQWVWANHLAQLAEAHHLF